MCFHLLGLSFSQSFNNDRFASTSRTNHHGSVTRHHCLIQLHHLVRLHVEIAKFIIDPFCKMLSTLLILGICFLYYRPQRSWAKVTFSQACICPQGGGVSASVHAGIYPPPQSRPPLE